MSMRHVGPPLQEVGDPVLLAMPIHDGRVFRPMADALAEDGGDDAVRRPLHQLPGKAAADAVAHVEELVDAEVIHQPELVVGEGPPGVVDRHGAGGLAAIGVALVHRDAAEVVRECFHGVDHRGRPVADAGVQAPTGGDQQWEAGASLLVADADVALVIERHGSLSLPSVVCCGRARLDEPREPLESSRHYSATAARWRAMKIRGRWLGPKDRCSVPEAANHGAFSC